MSEESKQISAASHPFRRSVWLVLGVTLAALVLSALWPTADGLEVDGVAFRIWVAHHPDYDIEDPLAAVGTNAIPDFLRIIREPPESPTMYRMYRAKKWLWDHLPQWLQGKFRRSRPVPQWQLKRTALFGLRFLGPEAKAALPDILRAGRSETNIMVQASALVAALAIAPESPDTFRFWREQWEGRTYPRRDLAIYLRAAHYPITAAVPLLLEEAKRSPNPAMVLQAFEFMGEAAGPAVPLMAQALRPGNGDRIIPVFVQLGPTAAEVVPHLSAYLNETNPSVSALEALKAIGSEARSALPQIEWLMTNADPVVRMLAASAAARIQGKPELALPILLDGLEGKLPQNGKSHMDVSFREPIGCITEGAEAAAILLADCGRSAQIALPALEKHLQDNNQFTRLACAQAIFRISGNIDKALPVLLDILDKESQPKRGKGLDKYVLVRTIETIEEMGPAAKAAIPLLKRVKTSCMAARHAVNSALPRIEAAP